MSDNPKKRGPEDRRNVSSQPWELGHVIKTVTRAHPEKSRDDVMRAIFDARNKIQPSESRDKLMKQIEQNLKKLS